MRSSRRESRSSLRRLLPDTNVLVYETVEDSPHHEIAVNLIDAAGEIILPSIVVHEYTWVMVRKLGVDPLFVAEKLREYLEDPRVIYTVEPLEVLRAALRLLAERRANPSNLNDYVILETARYYNASLATFDEKLKSLAKTLGLQTLP